MDVVKENIGRWVNKEEEHRKLVVNKEEKHRRLVVKTDHRRLVWEGKRRRGLVGKESFRKISREVVG